MINFENGDLFFISIYYVSLYLSIDNTPSESGKSGGYNVSIGIELILIVNPTYFYAEINY